MVLCSHVRASFTIMIADQMESEVQVPRLSVEPKGPISRTMERSIGVSTASRAVALVVAVKRVPTVSS